MVSIFCDFSGSDDEILEDWTGNRIVMRSGTTRKEGRKHEAEQCSLHSMGGTTRTAPNT